MRIKYFFNKIRMIIERMKYIEESCMVDMYLILEIFG